jgi:hypothetical protein
LVRVALNCASIVGRSNDTSTVTVTILMGFIMAGGYGNPEKSRLLSRKYVVTQVRSEKRREHQTLFKYLQICPNFFYPPLSRAARQPPCQLSTSEWTNHKQPLEPQEPFPTFYHPFVCSSLSLPSPNYKNCKNTRTSAKRKLEDDDLAVIFTAVSGQLDLDTTITGPHWISEPAHRITHVSNTLRIPATQYP